MHAYCLPETISNVSLQAEYIQSKEKNLHFMWKGLDKPRQIIEYSQTQDLFYLRQKSKLKQGRSVRKMDSIHLARHQMIDRWKLVYKDKVINMDGAFMADRN